MIGFVLSLLSAVQTASAYDGCLNRGDAAKGIQAALQACADQEFERQDALLNRSYKAKMASLGPSRQASLRGSQRQWIVARDRRCGSKGGGTMARFDTVDCLATQTAMRTRWLERYR